MAHPGSGLSMDELFSILNRRLGISNGINADNQLLSDASASDSEREMRNFQYGSTDEELRSCTIMAGGIHSAFQRHQNSFRPINRLPDKILGYIFHLIKPIPEPPTTVINLRAELDPAFRKGANGGFSKALGWIKVSWICQHWRRVALSTPTLWSDVLWKIVFSPHVAIPPNHSDFCEFRFKVKPNIETTDASIAFVERSGDEPLCIKQLERYKESDQGLEGCLGFRSTYWNCYGLPPNPFYEALKLQTHRIRTWEIRTAYIVQENIWAVLTLPFPIISEFHLEVDSPVDTRKWENLQADAKGSLTPSPRYSLPMLFGQREVPTLRRLSLWRYSRWPHNSFPNLTHLSLNEQYVDFRPSVDEFLDMLESMPMLQFLHMDVAGPVIRPDFVLPSRKIELRYLWRIEMHWRTLDSENVPGRQCPPLLMQCLEMPPDVQIMYVADEVLDDEEHLDPDLPPKKYMDNIKNLKVIINGEDQFVLQNETLHIETSSFHWFINYAPYLPNLETLFFLSDGRLNSRFPNFVNLKYIDIAITDGLIHLMRAFAHPIPCCLNLEELTVHGRADPTLNIEDATDTERETVEKMLREGEVLVNRWLHRRTYWLVSERDYLEIYSFKIPFLVGGRQQGPFKWKYKYDISNLSLYN